MAFANGYTMALIYNLDGLGWTYIALATFWTIILLIGITFLVSKRNLPFLRIRNVPLAVSAVVTVHVYWVLCMIAYVLQGFFPCSTEYWIMSIYLPLGIALFQACNTQLLHIADVQRRYTENHYGDQKNVEVRRASGWRRYLAYLYVQNRVKRTMAFIAYGMVIQVLIAMLVFLISRKFHPTFGVTGSGLPEDMKQGSDGCVALQAQYAGVPSCEAAMKIECRRGWEWIPSIVWQFFWSWCYAPYLLWRVHDIKDVHGWRRQTTFCCLAGLFATPMWLCALYIEDMHIVNRYYVPPLWFAPSIFLIEAFLVFVPCYQVFKNRRLQSETLGILAEWECKNNGSSLGAETGTMQSSDFSTLSKKPSRANTVSTTNSRRGEMYTMTALESAIRTNPQPLLLFAALKDFSGENITFLIKVLEWKRGWLPGSPSRSGFLRRLSVHEVNNKSVRSQQFKHAIDIYASYVSLKYSDYPINLSHAHLKELEAVFEGATLMLYGTKTDNFDSNSATPFDAPSFSRLWQSRTSAEAIEPGLGNHPDATSVHSHLTSHTSVTHASTDLILAVTGHNSSKRSTLLQTHEMSSTATSELPEYVHIPQDFDPHVFDRAEESIKYMVLTNTWPKFVNAGYANAGIRNSGTILQDMRGRVFGWKS